MSGPLKNTRHERFAQELAKGKSAAEAYVLAGFKANDGNSIRLKGNERVAARLAELVGKAAGKAEVTVERTLAEIAKIAFSSLSDVTDWGTREVAFGFDDEGRQLRAEEIGDAVMVRYADAPFVKPVNRDDLTPEARAAVSEVALTKDGFRIKMHDKNAALEKLGRFLKMFTDKHEHTGKDGAPLAPGVILVLPANGRD